MMSDYLPTQLKGEIRARYRQYLSYCREAEKARSALKEARASRLWVLAVVLGLFSFDSDFLLGAFLALLGVYVYRILAAKVQQAQTEDNQEDLARWFAGQGILFEDQTPFLRTDEARANPLDLNDEALYA